MKDAVTKEYCAAFDDYTLCADVSQLPAKATRLAAAEKAWRAANPGKFHQAAAQVATLEAPADEAPVNEDR